MSLLLIRHSTAGDRESWEGDDRLRPVDERGRRQSEALIDALAGYTIDRIVSSPYLRCVQTVEPLAEALGVELEEDPRLEEGAGAAAATVLREDGVVCCTHGDIVEELLGHSLKKGAAVVLEDGRLVREIPAP